MAGKFTFTPEDYQTAAIKYRREILMTILQGVMRTIQYMTGRPGIRYKERVGEADADAQFAPYDPTNETDVDLKIGFRELETFFGSVVKNFEPNSAVSTLLGTGATKGDGQMQTPTAKLVLQLMAKKLSWYLNNAIWKAKRNPAGKTTMDLFDGFDTITQKEIDATNISAEKGNYIKLPEEITNESAVEVIRDNILFKLDEELRAQTCYLYCSQSILDKYNVAYQMVNGALPYNREFGHTSVEGSEGKLIFCPLSNKAGSDFIHVSPKRNMLVGYDSLGDVESIEVARFKPFVLSFIATMFFGTQFERIDKQNLFVADLRVA